MNCKSVESLLSAYLDNELTGHDSLAIREHLSGCRDCRAEETQLRSLKHLLRGMPEFEPSEGFEERLLANVVHSDLARPSRGKQIFIFSSVAAAAMVATLVLTTLLNPVTRPSTPAHESIAGAIERDLMFEQSTDPLSGARVIIPTNYVEE